jgi:hypothetical protein
LIVFDASAVVSAALKADTTSERALLRAEEVDVFALSTAVDTEIAEVLQRPKFAHAISQRRRQRYLTTLRNAALWFEPDVRVTDCRGNDAMSAAGGPPPALSQIFTHRCTVFPPAASKPTAGPGACYRLGKYFARRFAIVAGRGLPAQSRRPLVNICGAPTWENTDGVRL